MARVAVVGCNLNNEQKEMCINGGKKSQTKVNNVPETHVFQYTNNTDVT